MVSKTVELVVDGIDDIDLRSRASTYDSRSRFQSPHVAHSQVDVAEWPTGSAEYRSVQMVKPHGRSRALHSSRIEKPPQPKGRCDGARLLVKG